MENGLIDNAARLGEIALARLNQLKEQYNFIGDVRGKGLMIGVEFVADKKSKKPIKDKRDAVVYEAFKQGLLLLGAGETAVRIIPPLIINEEELQVGLDIFEIVIKKIFKV